MASSKSYHATEIRNLRAEVEEQRAEIIRLQAALEEASRNKENQTDIASIIKKAKDEYWLEYRNKEKGLTDTIETLKAENASLKKKNAALEERTEEWKSIAVKKGGPAKVHKDLKHEKAAHAKTQEELRKLKNKYEVAISTVCSVDHSSDTLFANACPSPKAFAFANACPSPKADALANYEAENRFLRTNLEKKEQTIKELSGLVKTLQMEMGKMYTTIKKLDSAAIKRNCVLYRFMCAKSQTTLEDYHLPDIATVLREMAINGNIDMVVRVNRDTYDLVLSQGISRGIPQWMFFNNIAKVMGIDVDKILFNMPINGNHYTVVMSDRAPIHISL